MAGVLGRVVRSEWTKLLSTKTWLGLLLGACLLAGGFAALFTGLAGQSGDNGPGLAPVGTTQYEQMVLSVAAFGTTFTNILGIIGMTQEYRHRTATPTFLTTPHRWHVVVGKLIAYALAAVPFAAAVCGVTLLVAEVYSAGRGAALSLTSDNVRILWSAGVVMVVFAVIGVGLGALLRNQVAAIVGALVYLSVVEPLVASIGPISGAYKWLPGGAENAILSSSQAGTELLDAWQGGLLLLAYGLVFALLGTLIAVRRDIV